MSYILLNVYNYKCISKNIIIMNKIIPCNMNNKKKNWIGITLTQSAVQRILHLVNDNSGMLGIKITIKKSGCAGFTYKIDKAIFLEENNIVYEKEGAKLFIPLSFMPFIDGSELDYVQEGLNFSFKFKNPKAQFFCGCGESFGIE